MKLITLFFLLISIVNAITIDLKSTHVKEKISNSEVSALIAMFKMNHINISKKNAKEVVRDNRLLSEQYIKEYGLNNEYLTTLRLSIEKDLAEKLVAENLKQLDVNDDVIKSYYIDNKEDYKKPDEVKLKIYEFNDYDSAQKFYKLFSKNIANIDLYSTDNNISIKEIKSPIVNLNALIAIAANVTKKEINKISYPIRINGKFILVEPIEYYTNLYQDYKLKKDEIKLKLLLKISNDKRKELLEKYR